MSETESFYASDEHATPTLELDVALDQNSAGAWRGKVRVTVHGPVDLASSVADDADTGQVVASSVATVSEHQVQAALQRNLVFVVNAMNAALAVLPNADPPTKATKKTSPASPVDAVSGSVV